MRSGRNPRPLEAVTLRIETGFRYNEIATALGKPSANAVRMTVTRALVRLPKEMGDGN
jgi:DNA-directed RNA polymerase specialized sigma24 family protein